LALRFSIKARVISVHDWRVRFRIEERTAIVERISSGYRASQLYGERAADANLDVHRAFAAQFGA